MKRFFLFFTFGVISAMDADQKQPQSITLAHQLVQSFLQEHRLAKELQDLSDQKDVDDATKKLLQEKFEELKELRSWTEQILATRETEYNEICAKVAKFSSNDGVYSPRSHLSHSAPTLEQISQPPSPASPSPEKNLPRSRSSSLGRALSVKFSTIMGGKSDG